MKIRDALIFFHCFSEQDFSPTVLKIFHAVNGLDSMEEGDPNEDPIPDEVFANKDKYREKKEIEIIADETQNGMPWSRLKSCTLKIEGKSVKNPFSSRFFYPRPESNGWVQVFRKQCKHSHTYDHLIL